MTLVCLTWFSVQLLVYEVFKVYCLGSVHADLAQVSSPSPNCNPSQDVKKPKKF